MVNAQNTINEMNNKYGFNDTEDTVNYLLGGAQEQLNENDALHNTDVQKLLEDCYEEAYGTKVDKSEDDAYDRFQRAIESGEEYKDAVDLLKALTALQKALNDMGAQGNLFDGQDGSKARALKDPQGIVYEAVLSNPVVGATATLWQKDDDAESQWNAADYS